MNLLSNFNNLVDGFSFFRYLMYNDGIEEVGGFWEGSLPSKNTLTKDLFLSGEEKQSTICSSRAFLNLSFIKRQQSCFYWRLNDKFPLKEKVMGQWPPAATALSKPMFKNHGSQGGCFQDTTHIGTAFLHRTQCQQF